MISATQEVHFWIMNITNVAITKGAPDSIKKQIPIILRFVNIFLIWKKFHRTTTLQEKMDGMEHNQYFHLPWSYQNWN